MPLFIKNFLWIVCAALAASALGAVFACVVALVSPEFVQGLFNQQNQIVRYAAGMGMIWGLFLGAGAMAFSLFISAITGIFSGKK